MSEFNIVEHLRGLGNGTIDPGLAGLGLCNELTSLSDIGLIGFAQVKSIVGLMVKWPEYSGDEEYPVPHPKLRPFAAYASRIDIWDDSEYGQARRRLCLWLADQLEEDNNNQQHKGTA